MATSTRASLPVVVVLPVPLTPTTITIAGLPSFGMALMERSISGWPASIRHSRSMARASSSLETPRSAIFSRRESVTFIVDLVPKSAMMSVSSTSSQASSSRSPADKIPISPWPMAFCERERRPRKRPRRPPAGAISSCGAGAGAGSPVGTSVCSLAASAAPVCASAAAAASSASSRSSTRSSMSSASLSSTTSSKTGDSSSTSAFSTETTSSGSFAFSAAAGSSGLGAASGCPAAFGARSACDSSLSDAPAAAPATPAAPAVVAAAAAPVPLDCGFSVLSAEDSAACFFSSAGAWAWACLVGSAGLSVFAGFPC